MGLVKHLSDEDLNDPAILPAAIRNGDYVVKDSGQRRQFETGAVRDAAEGKGFFHCLPFEALEAAAKLYEAGAKKYGKNNWQKGMPLSVFLDSLLRHALKLANGWKDEDHAAAVCFNVFAFIWTAAKVKSGELPKSLDDVGWTA
jgi:cytochrome c peroxidase